MGLFEVKHQGRAQRLLQRAASRARIPHAYIFHGPDGVGKEMTAVGLAQWLLCESPVERALSPAEADDVGIESLRTGCGQCVDCRAVAAQTHPDMHLIYRQLNREHPDSTVRQRKALEIGVDVLRHFVIARVGYTPIRGRAKVFIIREADRITPQAQNALLKTLEEPPGTTFIILLAAAADQLLPTTLSRCQVVPFGTLPLEFIRDRINDFRPGLPSAAAEWYASFGAGSIGRALAAIDDDLFAVHDRLTASLESHVCDRSAASQGVTKHWTEEAGTLAEQARKRDPDISDTEATRRGLVTVLTLLADIFASLLRGGVAAPRVGRGQAEGGERLADRVGPEQAISGINRIALAQRQLDLNVNTQLCVETLANDLGDIHELQAAPATHS